ncbi:S41 family peptidase [Candidatus Saccharibacteria bacterium]|nr:S41 family peptidase [Candidatus Saccharibacteria bacterium]
MAERKHVFKKASGESRVPAGVMAIAFVFVLGLGYIAGTYNVQILSAVAPIFGLKSYSGTLDLSNLQKTYQELKANYDGDIDESKLIEGAQKGLVEAVGDEYTVYLNKTEAEAFNNDLSGTIGGGIGVELSLRNEVVTAVRVLKDNPAEKAGVVTGDVVIKVNDEAVLPTWTITDVVKRIRGEVGTTVKLTVARGSEIKEFTITRASVTNPSVYSTVADGVGTMTITRFDNDTGRLARAAAQSFKDQNVTSVILDLRGNGGGYITAAQDVAGLWLNDKIVVSERTDGKVVEELRTGRSPLLDGIPTAILVNSSSASASEIVAGALQDYGVAKLVGETTFGKGSVQKLITLPDGAELKVTIARWYTPKGKNISKQGVTVDTAAVLTSEDINAGRDPQLDAAKALLKR